MTDLGAVERNVAVNAEALERARRRNDSGNIPASPPASVTVGDAVPSRAVDKPEPYVGTIDESAGGPDFNEEKETEAERKGAIVSHDDEVLSWGRGGEVEGSVGWGDKPGLGPTAISAGTSLTATPPNQFNHPVLPDSPRGAAGNWNAADIFGKTEIG